jgi:hypothetical protein
VFFPKLLGTFADLFFWRFGCHLIFPIVFLSANIHLKYWFRQPLATGEFPIPRGSAIPASYATGGQTPLSKLLPME